MNIGPMDMAAPIATIGPYTVTNPYYRMPTFPSILSDWNSDEDAAYDG